MWKKSYWELVQGSDRLEVCYNSPKIIEIVTIKGRATEFSRVTPQRIGVWELAAMRCRRCRRLSWEWGHWIISNQPVSPTINATRDALGKADGGIYPEAGRGDFRG